jgi:hypothetical protein
MVVNVPGCRVNEGEEVVPYAGATPPPKTGIQLRGSTGKPSAPHLKGCDSERYSRAAVYTHEYNWKS